jgi:hypothetical protein
MTNNEGKNLSTRLGKREVFCTHIGKTTYNYVVNPRGASEV